MCLEARVGEPLVAFSRDKRPAFNLAARTRQDAVVVLARFHDGGPPSAVVAGGHDKDLAPTARPLASNEPATVARILVNTFPPKDAVARAQAMLADLNRLLPRHDWEKHLRQAMRSELGIDASVWLEPKAGTTKKPASALGALAGDSSAKARVRISAAPKPPATAAKVGPSKSVAALSEDLGKVLRDEQMRQAAPEGMEKCPLCGAIVEATRTKKVRTHDDPLTGMRCEGSGKPKS
jgi:hypothetical protein